MEARRSSTIFEIGNRRGYEIEIRDRENGVDEAFLYLVIDFLNLPDSKAIMEDAVFPSRVKAREMEKQRAYEQAGDGGPIESLEL